MAIRIEIALFCQSSNNNFIIFINFLVIIIIHSINARFNFFLISFKLKLYSNFPFCVSEIEPVSSDVIIVIASEFSEIPSPALCLVPKVLLIDSTLDSGRKEPA